jgi:EmrB/QacA subfamily drug resistance transporter
MDLAPRLRLIRRVDTGALPTDLKRAAHRARIVALIVAAGGFMQALDATVIVTAMPTMAHAFGVRASDLSLGITAYLLAMAAMVPMTGWVADRLGARNVFAGAVAIFTVASLLCALAPNLPAFTAARVLQGICGGLMGSVGRLVVMRNTDNRNMLSSVALMVWPALAAPIIGPVLGGQIVTHASWPWIFLINLPIGVIGLCLTLTFIPKTKAAEPPPLDLMGLVLAAGAMVCLVAALELVPHIRTPWPALAAAAIGATLAVTAWRRFKECPDPLIPLDALKVQTFATASLWGGWTFRMTVAGTPFVLPLLYQLAFGFSPDRAGLLMAGYFAGNLGMKPFTTFVLRMFGFRQVLVCNTLICTVATGSLLLLSPQTTAAATFALTAIAGASRSMQFTALDSLTYCDIPAQRRAGATTVWAMTNQLASVMGVAFPALILGLLPRLRGDAGAGLTDFHTVIIALTVLSVLGLPAFLRLPKDAGADVTGHRAR